MRLTIFLCQERIFPDYFTELGFGANYPFKPGLLSDNYYSSLETNIQKFKIYRKVMTYILLFLALLQISNKSTLIQPR